MTTWNNVAITVAFVFAEIGGFLAGIHFMRRYRGHSKWLSPIGRKGAAMTEQWTGDWMRNKETGQIIGGPVLNRYEMFMLIQELRVIIDTHTQSISGKNIVIETAEKRIEVLKAALVECRRVLTIDNEYPPDSTSVQRIDAALAPTESKS